MLQIIIALTLLALVILVLVRPDPATLRRYWRSILLWGGLGLLLVLVLAGRLHWLVALAAGAYTLFRRLLPLLSFLPLLRRLRAENGQRNAGKKTDAGSQASGPSPAGTLTVEEARAILGVDTQADKAAIVAAHRRLMQKVHPDRGGSDYLASRINAAKNVLLKHANS